jgi:hypothetical protein
MSRALIHGHTCLDCGKLVTCLVRNCEIRGSKLEASFVCGCETPAMSPTGHVEQLGAIDRDREAA